MNKQRQQQTAANECASGLARVGVTPHDLQEAAWAAAWSAQVGGMPNKTAERLFKAQQDSSKPN